MITERIALVMLDGEAFNDNSDPHHTRQYYKSIQAFANASLTLCEGGKFKKLQSFIKVAFRLFKEGNETVKNGIVNVIYLHCRDLLIRILRQESGLSHSCPGNSDLNIREFNMHQDCNENTTDK